MLKGKKNKKVCRSLRTLLSPVTTITRMPAVIHESMAFLTSSLGGSSIPTYITENREKGKEKGTRGKQTFEKQNKVKTRKEF